MIFKKGYIFTDLKFNEDLLVIGNRKLRKNYYILFKNLKDNSIFTIKREDILYLLDVEKRFKFKEVLK